MVSECYMCGASNEDVELYDAISIDKLIKICEKCSIHERIPIVNRPSKFQLKTADQPYTVYERLSRMAGLNPIEHKEKFSDFKKASRVEQKKQETSLREIVDKNYQKKSESFSKSTTPHNLIQNFNWVILRARRMKKLTQEELSKVMGVSMASIMDLEAGRFPSDGDEVVDRLENFLKIKIKKSSVEAFEKELKEKKKVDFVNSPKFDPKSIKGLTISDLREIKEGLQNKSFGDESVHAASQEDSSEKPKKKFSFSNLFKSKKGSEKVDVDEIPEDIILDEDVEVIDEREK